MKKITAILQNCQVIDKMFNLREKQVKTAFEASKNDLEEQLTNAEIEYENACKALGENNVNYKGVINAMLRAKAKLNNIKLTIEALAEIEADLNKDVEVSGIESGFKVYLQGDEPKKETCKEWRVNSKKKITNFVRYDRYFLLTEHLNIFYKKYEDLIKAASDNQSDLTLINELLLTKTGITETKKRIKMLSEIGNDINNYNKKNQK